MEVMSDPKISSRRFKKSPFFDCYHHDDVLYGVYNKRLYPLSCGYDVNSHYEHLITNACMYDVPETPLRFSGPDVVTFMEKIFTRNIRDIAPGRAVYAFACNDNGGIIMDGVLLHPNEEEYIYVQADGDFINWANAQKGDLDASVEDFNSWVLQIQGPSSLKILEKITGINASEFSYYSASITSINNVKFYVSRTGWTGEKGFEIYSFDDAFNGEKLWNYLLEAGEEFGLIASDIASMHIRRIQAGILDYGTDFDDSLNPYELGLGNFIDLERSFIGQSALKGKQESPLKIFGLICEDHTPTYEDKIVNAQQEVIGSVSAGAKLPSKHGTNIGIMKIDVPDKVSDNIYLLTPDSKIIDIKLVKLPFKDPEKQIPKSND